MKCSVYIAASVDGFIAKPDGDIAWLQDPKYGTSLNGLTYETFIASVDALVMGRNTFEKVRSFGFWPYEGLPVIVLSRQEMTAPKDLEGSVRFENASPPALVASLAREGFNHLYIDGGVTIRRFLKAGLIDEITITRIPILLGAGISLFERFGAEIPLGLIASTPCENGFVQTRYTVMNGAPAGEMTC